MAGRQDLIGSGCDCLIPANPPKEALQARREKANQEFRGDYVHTIPRPKQPAGGYRPGRKTARRRRRDGDFS